MVHFYTSCLPVLTSACICSDKLFTDSGFHSFLSPCRNIPHTVMTLFLMLPEWSKVTNIHVDSQLYRDFSGCSESFIRVMDCRWCKTFMNMLHLCFTFFLLSINPVKKQNKTTKVSFLSKHNSALFGSIFCRGLIHLAINYSARVHHTKGCHLV